MNKRKSKMSGYGRVPRADIYLIMITLIWGSTFAVTKYTLNDISPYMYQGIRFTLASIFVGIYTWRDIKATTFVTLRRGIILGVLLGIGFVLQTVGLGITTASKAAFLTGTLVVFTPLFQLVLERRLPTIPNVVGVVLTSIGLYIFTSPSNEAFNTGDLLVMICAVVFAVYVVYVDVFTKEKFSGELVFYQFVSTAIIGFVMVPFSTDGTLFRPSMNLFLALLYLAFFASTVALFVQTKYQRETTPTRAALIYTLEPIFAAILAALMLDEHMSSTAIFGAGLMFGGLVASELLTIRSKTRPEKSEPN